MDNVSVANAAFDKLGVKAITALTDDSKQAIAVNRAFARLRDLELTLNTWRFSVARASLAALADAPAFGFTRQFQLPADFLRLISAGDYAPGLDTSYLRGGLDAEDYTIEGRNILTNLAAPLKVRYVRRVESAAEWDPGFAEVLACRIAMELGPGLTESNTRVEKAMKDYQIALVAARRANALQLPAQVVADDTWLTVRR